MPRTFRAICKTIADCMGVLVLAVAALAFLWPGAFALLKPTMTSPLLGVVMFGMGLALKAEDFRVVLTRPKDAVLGCLVQFTVMPALAWTLAKAFALDEALMLGTVLVGCCPGGTASNVIAYLAKGDLALSVGMTALSTLVAPVATPLLVWALAGESVEVDAAGMFASILWVVIAPIAAGLAVKKLCPRATQNAVDCLPAVATLAICAIVAAIIAANASRLASGGLQVAAVVALHNVLGLALGYAIARAAGMPPAKRRAVAIETGMQNSGLAVYLATTRFAAYPMAAVPGAIFSVWHNLSGAATARIFALADKMQKVKQQTNRG